MGLLSRLLGRRVDAPGTTYEIRDGVIPGSTHVLWRVAPGQADKRIMTSSNLSEVDWYRREYEAGRRPSNALYTYQRRVDHGIDPTGR